MPPTKFDHAEARRLRATGLTYTVLAAHFDVSVRAVQRVCDPAVREQMGAHTRQWMRDNKRELCLGGCGRLVWMSGTGNRTGLCRQCLGAKRRSETVVRHGTEGGYKRCHCDLCRAAATEARRRRRRAARCV